MHPSGQTGNQRRKMRLLVLVLILLGNLPAWVPGPASAEASYNALPTANHVTNTQYAVRSTQYPLGEPAIPAPFEVSQGSQRYFAQTAHFLRGAFLDYWQAHGAT